MAYPTFSEIAERLDIARCRGILPSGHRCHLDHRRGVVSDGMVHWADRGRVERAGVRRFLKLSAFLLIDDDRPWARIWLAQRYINNWASQIGMTFPSSLTDDDRLEVRAMLINVPTDTPGRQEAMAWAQQKK